MNTYRERLQEALLAHNKRPVRHGFGDGGLYAVCAGLAYAAILVGWAGAIISHL